MVRFMKKSQENEIDKFFVDRSERIAKKKGRK